MNALKIAGVSIWIWILGIAVISAAVVIAVPKIRENITPLPLEVVKSDIWKNGGYYEIRGEIHNPRSQPARNVSITFDMNCQNLRETGKHRYQKGKAQAELKYIPAGGSVDFIASSPNKVKEHVFVEFGDAIIIESKSP